MLKLSNYAGGKTINDGKTPAAFAFINAFADIERYREPLWIDVPGGYMIDQPLQPPSFAEIIGQNRLTELIHHPTLRTSVFIIIGKENVKLRDFHVSGGVGREPSTTPPGQRLNDDTNGYVGAEVTFDGYDCSMIGITLKEWNNLGATIAGYNPYLEKCWGRATPKPIYKPDSGPTASADFGSTYAFLTTSESVCDGLRMVNCGATGTRGPGGFPGGTNGEIANWFSQDCHREYCPSNPQGFTSGGGQLALSKTRPPGGAAGAQQPMRWTITSPFILDCPGPAVTGLELDHAWGVDVVGAKINGNMTGISVNNCRMINLSGFVGGTRVQGLNVFESTYVRAEIGFEWCNTAAHVSGVSDYIDLRGSMYYANIQSTWIESAGANIQY